MARANVPAPAPGQPSPEEEIDDIPANTSRAFDRCMNRFNAMLSAKTTFKMHARRSRTPTDADVEDAYRELTHTDSPSAVAIFIGDGAMIVGAFLMPFCTTHHWCLFPAGLLVAGLGLYVREFSKKWG
jgi:hypothetical protein